ncbi:MAG: hypothetical protein AB7L13_06010 [Acidimicrobiia bacterium]
MHHSNDDDDLVAAIGKASEALEAVERARGHLYSFHQLIGHADFEFSNAARMMSACGLAAEGEAIDIDLVGRNVIDGRWTFQVVEEFDDLYYATAVAAVRGLEKKYLNGMRHVLESRVKEQRRTHGRVGHESRPPAAASPVVDLEGGR